MKTTIKKRALAYITLTRIIGWGPFLFPLLLGLVDSGFSSLFLVFLSLLIFGPFLLGGIYTLNFYSDIEVDRRSEEIKDVEMAKQPLYVFSSRIDVAS